MNTEENDHSLVPWKVYLGTTIETLLAFYLATFSIAMFFIHRGNQWFPLAAVMGTLYLLVIFCCAKRIKDRLPISAIMLIIPIAPLIALFMVVSLIPLLQVL